MPLLDVDRIDVVRNVLHGAMRSALLTRGAKHLRARAVAGEPVEHDAREDVLREQMRGRL